MLFSAYMSPPRTFTLLAFMVLFSACGSKGAVSLSARVEGPEINSRSSALERTLEGRFNLVLELGDAAPRATTVTLGAFGIESDAGPVIERLDVTPAQDFPLTLGEGDSANVACTLNDNGIEADVDPCAGEVWIVGNVTDTLNDGRPTRANSDRFRITCE
jgi:hypothetical protein